MAHLVASITLDSARSYVMQSAFITQRTVSSIPIVFSWSDSIRPEASDEELEELMKDQFLPADASPIALSSGYISDSDPEEEDEEDQRRILLTILPTEETMMIMSHLVMTTMIMMLRGGGASSSGRPFCYTYR
ncbi:hypothetical protein Tco_0425512 [Tanacetum coccineum]